MALELRNRVQRELGISLSATVALSHDSVVRLAAHLAARLSAEAEPDHAVAETAALRDLPRRTPLDADVRPSGAVPPLVPARRVFLTGATGFVGAHVLADLLSRGLEVACVVRAADEPAAVARVLQALRAYGTWDEAWRERLSVLRGDVEKPRLGLSAADYALVADEVDLVLHVAAAVNWVKPFAALEPVNVRATAEVLRLSCAGRPKALHHVSTLGTLGVYRALGQTPPGIDADARPLNVGQATGYFQSKWVAEQMVLEARRRGLTATVHRPGLVTGHSRTGVDSGAAGQFFFSLVKGCIQMGRAPRWGGRLRLVPVDYVARAIVTLALHPEGQGRDVNLDSHSPLPFASAVDVLRRMGFALADEDYGRWHASVLDLPRTDPANALAGFAMFLSGVPSEETAALEAFSAADVLDDARTRALLEAVGLECPATDADLIRTYVQWYVSASALEAPRSARHATEAAP